MSSPTKVHDTLVYRLSQVLTKLNQGESLDQKWLRLFEQFYPKR